MSEKRNPHSPTPTLAIPLEKSWIHTLHREGGGKKKKKPQKNPVRRQGQSPTCCDPFKYSWFCSSIDLPDNSGTLRVMEQVNFSTFNREIHRGYTNHLLTPVTTHPQGPVMLQHVLHPPFEKGLEMERSLEVLLVQLVLERTLCHLEQRTRRRNSPLFPAA